MKKYIVAELKRIFKPRSIWIFISIIALLCIINIYFTNKVIDEDITYNGKADKYSFLISPPISINALALLFLSGGFILGCFAVWNMHQEYSTKCIYIRWSMGNMRSVLLSKFLSGILLIVLSVFIVILMGGIADIFWILSHSFSRVKFSVILYLKKISVIILYLSRSYVLGIMCGYLFTKLPYAILVFIGFTLLERQYLPYSHVLLTNIFYDIKGGMLTPVLDLFPPCEVKASVMGLIIEVLAGGILLNYLPYWKSVNVKE
ncbi:hypothetical protein [Caldicoprobacter faecalis]|uniref:ABC-2 family transporter protein n=1 Tax=Caldicoprobacter faecalis TaxID=937334 RepID=A0A1I5WAT3_9FIRM|nr:hypothetical protein [Caldicoprobacter faecalis]SFQ16848.1 hypothetical protein SAMN05444406_11529 [Caldicoprobacter faecalis]